MTVSARVALLPPGTTELQIKDVEIGDPREHEVLIRQQATGVCHSQLHVIHRDRTEACLLGHESTGIVEAVGSAVQHVGPGDKVLVTWVPRAPQREYRAPQGSSLTLGDGSVVACVSNQAFTWATHTVADELYVVKAPEGTPMDTGAIIGCAVMTGAGAVLNSAQVAAGQSVAVWGAGGVGLSAIVAARNVGADPIIAVDLDDEKLDMARRFGAGLTVNANDEDAVQAVRRLTPGSRPGDVGGVDFAFDCIGRPIATQQAIASLRRGHMAEARGGKAFLVGVPQEPFMFDSIDLMGGEKSFSGSVGGSSVPETDYPTFVEWYRSGRLDLDSLVTARYALDDVNQACRDLENGKIAGRAILDLGPA